MALIALEGMRFHALHGVYEAERILGTTYLVDVYIRTDISKASAEDDLAKTVNYESVFLICKQAMATPKNLIEAVIEEIANGLKRQFQGMEYLRICLRKLDPPVGGQVYAALVEQEYDFLSGCPRCGKKFISYASGDCWDKLPNLHPATRETLVRQFGGKCLCDNCLAFYAG